MTTVQKGTWIRVSNHSQIADSVRHVPPLTFVAEAVRNSAVRPTARQAAGQEPLHIVIYPTRSRKIAIADNAAGIKMEEMAPRLGDIGDSGGVGSGEMTNPMGLGMKLAMYLNPHGVSWLTRAEGRQVIARATLGQIDSDQKNQIERYGWLIPPERYEGPLKAPGIGEIRSGTIVELLDTLFDFDEIVQFLYGHFRAFPTNVRVRVIDGERAEEILGAEHLMRTQVDRIRDNWAGEHFTAIWGIERDNLKPAERRLFDGISLRVFLGTRGGREEVVRTHSRPFKEGGKRTLEALGITVGGERVRIFVFPKARNKRLRPSLDRGSIQGWEFSDAVNEMMLTMPGELFDYVRSQLDELLGEREVSAALRRAVLKSLMESGIRSIPSIAPPPVADDEEDEGRGDPPPDTDPETRKRRPKTRKGKNSPQGGSLQQKNDSDPDPKVPPSEPDFLFVGKNLLGTDIPYTVEVNPRRFLVNEDWTPFAGHLRKCRRPAQIHRLRLSLVTHIIRGHVRYLKAFNGRPPVESESLALALAWDPPFRTG